MLHEFEVISEHSNEVLGLMAEVANIQKHDSFENGLNNTLGGEGSDFQVVQDRNEFNELVFFVEHKQSAFIESVQAKRKTAEHWENFKRRFVRRFEQRLDALALTPIQLKILQKYRPSQQSLSWHQARKLFRKAPAFIRAQNLLNGCNLAVKNN